MMWYMCGTGQRGDRHMCGRARASSWLGNMRKDKEGQSRYRQVLTEL